MTRHSHRVWWWFGVTLVTAVAVVVAGSLHVAMRWEPRLLGQVQHGEWMEFETFRIRVDQIEVAESFAAEFEASDDLTARIDGMQLMLVRFSVERQDPSPESLAENDNAVCSITIFNQDGLAMDDTGYAGVADSPPTSGCSSFTIAEGDDQWGDSLNFQSQVVAAVTPDPISTFTIQVDHLQDDAGERWLSGY